MPPGTTQTRDIEDCTCLVWLDLSGNAVSDLGPVAGLTGLEYLSLSSNQIVDVSALSGLVNLGELDLRYNQIADIMPLVSNSGLGLGDHLWLRNNPLSEQSINQHIPALEARGVTVHVN